MKPGRGVLVLGVLSALALSTVVGALMLGTYELSPIQVVEVLRGRESGFAHTVVWEWRLPRALTALVVGACLGLSGALLQVATRNTLTSPDLIGISGGAYAAVLVTLLVVGGGWQWVGPAALIGGLLAAALVFLVASGTSGPAGGHGFLMVGIAVAALLSGLCTWLVTSASLETAMAAATGAPDRWPQVPGARCGSVPGRCFVAVAYVRWSAAA